MIIKASQRGGYRNLANHLTNAQDNDHVTFYETRGMIGNSLHAALAEIDAVSQGTRCRQPMFSVSFNPPEYADVTHEQFEQAFEKLEAKLGLVDLALWGKGNACALLGLKRPIGLYRSCFACLVYVIQA